MKFLNKLLILLLAPISLFADLSTSPIKTDSQLCKAILEKPIALEKVKAAVELGYSINVYCIADNHNGFSPLYLSLDATKAPQNDSTISEYLIEKGAALDFSNYYPVWKHKTDTITNFAAVIVNGNLNLAKAFLKQKPDLKSPSGQIAVGLAFLNKHWEVAELLLNSGANKYSIQNSTAVMHAIKNGAPDNFLEFLFKDWNFNYDNTDLTDGYLYSMIRYPTSPIFVQKIIAQGANPKSIQITTYLTTLLEPNVKRGNAITVLAHTQPYGPTPKLLALTNYLFSLGLDPSENNPILVPAYNNAEVLNWFGILLLEHGANPNVSVPLDTLNKNVTFSALQLAIFEGGGAQLDFTKSFLDHGANLNYVTNTNATALCFAVGSTGSVDYRPDIAFELIRRGADVNGPCGESSILCRAKGMIGGQWKGSQEVYETLVQKGALLGPCKY